MKMVESYQKRAENTVRKGEIARNEQFLFFPQCFKRLVLQTRKNEWWFGIFVGIWKPHEKSLPMS